MANMTQDSTIEITRLELGPFGTNAYVIICQATGDSILVDVPAEPGRILRQLDGTNPKYILITHSHIDHIGALDELRSELKIPVAGHPLDALNLPSRPDVELGDGDTINLGRLRLKILHTPGHTPGSLCFLVGKYLISGDTIFPGGPGKTRTAADFKHIVNSIVTKIFVLPDDTEIYPGHGNPTILGKEKKEFTIFASRSHEPNLHGDVLWLSS
jgi:glyoxylase-like metal-dependent hydrolase (beta-lactamase superfamily II)